MLTLNNSARRGKENARVSLELGEEADRRQRGQDRAILVKKNLPIARKSLKNGSIHPEETHLYALINVFLSFWLVQGEALIGGGKSV